MSTLLVVHHAPTPAMRDLAESVLAGAQHRAIGDVTVVSRHALNASADDVNAADGIVLVTPANFGYMSGALKHFFDSTFLDIGGALTADGTAAESLGGKKPFGLLVHGRYDVSGAVRAVIAIASALPWRQAAPVLEVTGAVNDQHCEAAYELGATLAALIGQ